LGQESVVEDAPPFDEPNLVRSDYAGKDALQSPGQNFGQDFVRVPSSVIGH